MSETTADFRLDRLEADMRDVRAVLGQLVPMITRIDATLAATLPHLATKAEVADLRTDLSADIGTLRADLADKPGKLFLAGAIGVLIAAYALGLAGVTALPLLRALMQ
jgi:hypothetical protein